MLLIILLSIPLLGVLLLFLVRNRSINIPLITSSLVLLLGLLGLKDVFKGLSLSYKIGISGPFIFKLNADPLSAIFVILSAFLWMVVAIYTPKYMEYEGKTWSFQLCTVLTLFAVLGIFLSGDLLTMLFFFELMTISSYFWVIHRWDKGAIRAGYFYLFFSIAGGLLLALAIVIMGGATDSLPLIGTGMVVARNPKLLTVSLALFLMGFGVKAGMVPLHLWLPYAHSVAPTPGSGLLSGLLIKVGAYGLIRTGEFAGWGANLAGGAPWLGPTLIVLGTCTMLLGVTSALLQSNAKKLLAYHSISQMGYIILGLGVGLYLGSRGGLGLSGAIYHIINHALFKIALFLGVGIIYIHTGETDLYKLGGLWRHFPVTALLMLVAVLGITGAPGLNGYASKSLLHHGVSLAATTGGSWLIWIERLFLLVGVGTATSFAKLYYLIFLGKPTELEVKEGKAPSLQLAMAILGLVMLVIGIKPMLLLNAALVPAVETLGIKEVATSIEGLAFWNFRDILDMIITLGLGILACGLGFKIGVFHFQPPSWLTIEGLLGIILGRARLIGQGVLGFYSRLIEAGKNAIGNILARLNLAFTSFDQSKNASVFRVDLMGISVDVAILLLLLGILLAFYTIINPSL